MKINYTRDTLSSTYLDAVKIRNIVFVQGQGVPLTIEVDKNEAHCIHFVLYDDKNKACCNLSSFTHAGWNHSDLTAHGCFTEQSR